jgi:hypothetical protein
MSVENLWFDQRGFDYAFNISVLLAMEQSKLINVFCIFNFFKMDKLTSLLFIKNKYLISS